MALILEDNEFQHILRILNTNVDGREHVAIALTKIKGIGRRFANLICKKADIDLNKRAGELSEDEIEAVKTIIANPRQFNIPDWFLNSQKDRKQVTTTHTYHSGSGGCIKRALVFAWGGPVPAPALPTCLSCVYVTRPCCRRMGSYLGVHRPGVVVGSVRGVSFSVFLWCGLLPLS